MSDGATMRDSRSPPPWPGQAVAWALALLPAALLCVLLARPVWDVDIFWQLKLGELILDGRGPIRHEPFAVSHLGQPLDAVAWLGQAVFALVRRVGGWTGLRLFDALCWSGGFWLLAAACRRRGASAAGVGLALALSFCAALPAASIRPQTFGALGFGALLALFKLELRPWRTVALGAPLLVLWQNLHPSVSVGALALAAYAAGGWFAWWCDRTRNKPWAATILTPLALASVFATPDGIGILTVSARNAQASIAVGASEWLPLWIEANWINAVPVLVVSLIGLRVASRNRAQISWADAAVMMVLLLATVTAYRFVLFWAISTVPVLAVAAPSMAPVRNPRLASPVVLLLVAITAPWIFPSKFSENLPLAAVSRLRATPVQGTVYTEPEFAGVLIDAGYPRWHVTLDGRYYRYTDGEWSRYGDVLAGTYRLRAIERRYRPAAFVLRPSHTTALCNELDGPNSGWRRIYRDEGAAVWVPD